jgi:hypothetical protein
MIPAAYRMRVDETSRGYKHYANGINKLKYFAAPALEMTGSQ